MRPHWICRFPFGDGAQFSSVLTHRRVIHHHVNSVTETLNGEPFLWDWRRPNSDALDLPPPEGLVSEERTDKNRLPCQQSGGSRFASAMVYYSTNLRKEPVMRSSFNEQD